MATVEVLADQLFLETNSAGATIGGGAGSKLAALNDASDTTYLQCASTLTNKWNAWLRFAQPSIPAGAAVEKIQMRVRYSHWKGSTTVYEQWVPGPIAVGRPLGSSAALDLYSVGEKIPRGSYSLATSVQQWTGPFRNKSIDGKLFIGERYQMLPSRRLYGFLSVNRNSAQNTARIYSCSMLVTYNEKPVVTVLEPTGTITTEQFQCAWSFVDPEGFPPQQVFDLRIYKLATAQLAGFNIENELTYRPVYRRVYHQPQSTHKIDNTPKRPQARTGLLPIDIGKAGFGKDGESFRIFVRAKNFDIWSPGVNYKPRNATDYLAPLSNWDSEDFTFSFGKPLSPQVTAVYDSVKNGIDVTVLGLENKIEFNESTFEVSSTQITATGCSLALNASNSVHGTNSIQLTKTTGAGLMQIVAGSLTNVEIPVRAGFDYTARASFKTAVTARTCDLFIDFLDSAGSVLSATVTQHDVTDATTEFREAIAWATAPANAVRAKVYARVNSAALSEVHYIDAFGFFEGKRRNLLTEQQASLEATGTTGWQNGNADTTIARTAELSDIGVPVADDGHAFLSATRITSTGTILAQTLSGQTRVKGSRSYTARCKTRAKVTARSARINIDWYDSGNVFISSSTGTTVTNSALAWTTHTTTATSPAGAVFGRVQIEVQSAAVNETHMVDTVQLSPDAASDTCHTWTQGGWLHSEPWDSTTPADFDKYFIELQRSVDGGTNWVTLPHARLAFSPENQQIDFDDYEIPSLKSGSYRARVNAEDQNSDFKTGPWSQVATASMPQFTKWWLRDPKDNTGALTMALDVTAARLSTPKPNTLDYPIGSDSAVMSHDGSRADDLQLTINVFNENAYEDFKALVGSGDTLLLQDTLGRQWYVQSDTVEYEMLLLAKTPSEVWPHKHAHTVDVTFRSVERPLSLAEDYLET